MPHPPGVTGDPFLRGFQQSSPRLSYSPAQHQSLILGFNFAQERDKAKEVHLEVQPKHDLLLQLDVA
jgi:hypothetical protein